MAAAASIAPTAPETRTPGLDAQLFGTQYAAVAAGFSILAVAGLYGPAQLAVGGALFVLLWTGWKGDAPVMFDAQAWTGLSLGLYGTLGLMVYAGRLDVLDAVGWLLLLFPFVKLLGPKTGRDYNQVYAIAFAQLVLATILSSSVWYGVVFLGFVTLTVWGLTVLFWREAARRAGARAADVPRLEAHAAPRRTALSALAVAGAVSAGAFALFFVIPRPQWNVINLQYGLRQAKTGFNDNLELGDVGRIAQDQTPAFRASIEGPRMPGLVYWRGSVMTVFDGRKWLRGRHVHTIDLEKSNQHFRLERNDRPDDFFVSVILDDLTSPYVFHTGEPVEVTGAMRAVRYRFGGTLMQESYPQPVKAYRVRARNTPTVVYNGPGLDAFLVLPPKLDPRVVELAREWAGNPADGPRAVADRITAKLREGYKYTLERPTPKSDDPLVDFLFENRSGHCEYFATATAVMMRIVGIPTRLVGGYSQGERNEIENFYLVRQSNAHAWVEAYTGDGDQGWFVVDATPIASLNLDRLERSYMEYAAQLIDALRWRWQRYIIDFSAADQEKAVDQAMAKAYEARYTVGYKGLAAFDFLLPWLAAAWLVWAMYTAGRERLRRMRLAYKPKGDGRGDEVFLTTLWIEAERVLAARGVTRPPAVGHTAFARTAAAAHPALNPALPAFAAAYVRHRFASDPLTPEAADALRARLADVSAAALAVTRPKLSLRDRLAPWLRSPDPETAR